MGRAVTVLGGRQEIQTVITEHVGRRRAAGSLVSGRQVEVLGRPDRPERTDPDLEIDYTREGATWNFPAARKGRLDLALRLTRAADDAAPLVARKLGFAAGRLLAQVPPDRPGCSPA